MEITLTRPGVEVGLAGRLDVTGAHEARGALHEALGEGSGALVVDLAGVELIDATGLGVLVGAHRRAQRSGRVLVLRDPAERLLRVFSVTRLDRVLAIESTPASV